MKRMAKVLALLLVLVMSVSLLAACQQRPQPADETPVLSGGTQNGNDGDKTPAQGGEGDVTPAQQGGETEPAQQGGETGDPAEKPELPHYEAGITLANPASYAEIFQVLRNRDRGGYGGGMAVDTAAEAEAPAPNANAGSAAPGAADNGVKGETTPAGSPQADPANGETDHSGTNVQVDGVDEGDIFKTDGRTGYLLRNGQELLVLALDGAESTVLAQLQVGQSYEENNKWETEEGGSRYNYRYEYRYVSQMLLTGDRLVLIGTRESYGYEETYSPDDGWSWSNDGDERPRTYVEIYDISQPGTLTLLRSVELDGSLTDSRMTGGIVYLVTTWYCWNMREDDPATFVPTVTLDGANREIPLENIYVPEQVQNSAWCLAASLDVASGELVSENAILGGWGTVYMNADSLYIAIGSYRDEAPETYTEDQYLVEEHRAGTYTDIVRFAVAEGKLTYAGIGTVKGNLLNQFALDEQGGYLRVVTTTDGYAYKLYIDEKHGFTNYVWDSSSRTSGLYVLDISDMTLVSALDGLAESESVYSVRFMGNLCYFVTFLRTDPLFAVDLTDPLDPVLLSELKITGFSNYLHPWDTGLLFGIGMEADENGRTKGMKLAMFDTSDPTDLRVVDSLPLECSYSSALYDHHAILIDRAKNLIAFLTETGYEIYGYGDGGFQHRAHVDTTDTWYWGSARACWSGGYLYLMTDMDCHVLTLDTLEEVGAFKFPEELSTRVFYANGELVEG